MLFFFAALAQWLCNNEKFAGSARQRAALQKAKTFLKLFEAALQSQRGRTLSLRSTIEVVNFPTQGTTHSCLFFCLFATLCFLRATKALQSDSKLMKLDFGSKFMTKNCQKSSAMLRVLCLAVCTTAGSSHVFLVFIFYLHIFFLWLFI